MEKIIWLYWHQGESNAPMLVKYCINSWRYVNPGWDVRVLDEVSVDNWIDIEDVKERSDIGLQMRTDVLRLRLLLNYGGVWADATLFCVQSLDSWLSQNLADNFFAFSSAKADRVLTNWFLVGNRQSKILNAWENDVSRYWRNNHFAKNRSKLARGLSKFILRKAMSLRKRNIISNDFWFSPFFLKFLKLYPYPINMYLFEKMLSDNSDLFHIWYSSFQNYVDTPAEYLQNILGMNSPLTDNSQIFLEGKSTPVHKLNWRQDLGEIKNGSNLAFLIEQLSA